MENEKKAWQTPELQEMAVVVLSLHQKWWQKMAAGEKVLELRKSKPQCKAPFRVLVYVTGGTTYHIYTGKYSRRKKRGCDCTEIEAAEITLLFNFYKAELKRELEAFMVAFRSGNNLYPDKTARCYKENNGPAPERTDEEKRMLKKAAWYSQVLDKRRPPRALIGEPEVEED